MNQVFSQGACCFAYHFIPSTISSIWHIVGAQCLLNEYMHSLPKILYRDPREGLEKVKKLSLLNFCTGPFILSIGTGFVVMAYGYIMDSLYIIKGEQIPVYVLVVFYLYIVSK